METILKILSIVHSLVSVFGCATNILLIILAVFKTPKLIQTYSILILWHALADLGSCVTDIFVKPRVIPCGWTIAFTSSGICQYFNPYSCFVGLDLHLHFLSYSLTLLLASFCYRYYVLTRNPPSKLSLIVFLCGVYSFSLLQLTLSFMPDYEPQEVREALISRYPHYNLTDEIVNGFKDLRYLPVFYVIFQLTIPPFFMYIIILVLRSKIRVKLTVAPDHLRNETKEMHSQLLKALTIQATLPLFFSFGIINYSIGQFGILNHPLLENSTLLSVLLVPAFSPIISFVYIRPYRETFLQICGLSLERKKSVVEVSHFCSSEKPLFVVSTDFSKNKR